MPAPPSAADLEAALEKPEIHAHALLAVAQEPGTELYARAVEQLAIWPPSLWFRLDAARLEGWYGEELMPHPRWRAVIEDQNASALLVVLASTHRDGFLREAAARALARRTDLPAAAALAVRAFDHVPQVRDAARSALLARPPEGEATIVVPILHAAQGRRAAGDLLEQYAARLSPEAFRALLGTGSAGTRRFAARQAPLSVDELLQIAASRGDLGVRLIATRRALAQDPAAARRLLELRPASVRALAVASAPEPVVLAQLERFLLDRSALLRRVAQSRAHSASFDARAHYRASLPERTAVLGLGETGKRADAEVLVPLLRDAETASIRRAAIVSLGRLAAPELLHELLPPLLYDDEPAVAREAGRQLRRARFSLSGSELDRALAASHVWTRQSALGMAQRARGWEAPVAALALYDDRDESLREFARAAVRDWLSRRAASAGSPSPGQAERLRVAFADLERSEPGLTEALRFHAGLRP